MTRAAVPEVENDGDADHEIDQRGRELGTQGGGGGERNEGHGDDQQANDRGNRRMAGALSDQQVDERSGKQSGNGRCDRIVVDSESVNPGGASTSKSKTPVAIRTPTAAVSARNKRVCGHLPTAGRHR